MADAANEEELQLILSLDDTDVEEHKDDQASPSIRQSTNSFTVDELISVLERISSSMVKPEAALATAILLKTREKEEFTALDCFVSAFVEAFRQCNDCVQNFQSDSIRAIKLEREFSTLRKDQDSELFMAWIQLAGDAHSSRVDCSLVVFQHVLQHFWSCVTLKEDPPVVAEPQSPTVNVGELLGSRDEAEREAIRRHAGWAVKRARDVIHSGATVISIKRSKDDNTATEVTKKCLLLFFEKFGEDQRQDSGKFLFIVNDVVLHFFIIMHKMVQDYFESGIDKDTVVQCLKHLSVSEHLRAEWKKVVGVLSGEDEAASIILLQRIASMFVKSKQQIIREQLHLKPQKHSKSLRQTLSGRKK